MKETSDKVVKGKRKRDLGREEGGQIERGGTAQKWIGGTSQVQLNLQNTAWLDKGVPES